MSKCQNCFGGMGGVGWELTCTVTDINRRARDTEKPLFNSSITPPPAWHSMHKHQNRRHSINQYSNMVPRLLRQNCNLLSFFCPSRYMYKENPLNNSGLSWKPWSNVRILIYQMWTVEGGVGRQRQCQRPFILDLHVHPTCIPYMYIHFESRT